MGVPSLSLTMLIERVGEAAADGDELDRLAEAVSVSEEVIEAGDALVVHFVDEARRSGHSWTAIGGSLGVSKQAVRKRFGELHGLRASTGASVSIMPRLEACLRHAGEEARRDGSIEVGTHHQLRGLLLEGVGAAVLEKLGVTGQALHETSIRLFGEGGPAADVTPPESEEARSALLAAAALAAEAGSEAVGTEHLLFVLGTDPGARSRRLLNDLGVSMAAIKEELEFMPCPAANRRRRRRSNRRTFTCSFCGKGQVRLVHGEGVQICGECVRLATEILGQRDPGS